MQPPFQSTDDAWLAYFVSNKLIIPLNAVSEQKISEKRRFFTLINTLLSVSEIKKILGTYFKNLAELKHNIKGYSHVA